MESSQFPSSPPLAVHRILDANLDRAREGLRILEDWCRFGLNHRELTDTFKHLRQELAQWHTPDLRRARDTPGDPGTNLTHPQEETRTSLSHLLQANFCRVEEALRVLEEYGKLYNPALGSACKQMRYRVYALDSDLMGYSRHQQLHQARAYLVTAPTENLVTVVEAALQGGLRLVQYRDKDGDDCDRILLAQHLKELCHRYGALFLINDRVDLALAVDADGVHLGQKDLPIAIARQLLGPHRIIGRSTTNPEEMARAVAEGADYIGVGPVYATPTKPDRAAAGLDYVSYAAQHAPLPWYAIGGIDQDNLPEVMAAGAQRVAVVRAIIQAADPTQVTQQVIAQLNVPSQDIVPHG
ncbi:thiamine phosphate synthase [Leptolyngbya sp. PCC 6406]|uniref:thiamine phosphate synthase n=1 Tax=Leptolyngbya sp. PCC 6406 TaxID=1173264 RepID=UPI0002AC03C3|nr:thiamine phosphate synthase [Leptolyngbya sp. PCC 6406]